MKIKPLFNNILLRKCEEDDKTESGIIISTEKKENKVFGIVEAAGSSVKDLKQGDKVVYPRYCGIEVKLQQEKYLLIDYKNILAIIEE